MKAWCPFAQVDKANVTTPGYVDGYPWRGVLHTTESYTYPSARQDYYGHTYWPHFTVDGPILLQHLPITASARALENPAGGVETNRARAIQIEVCWQAAKPDWDDDTFHTTAAAIGWINEQTGIQAVGPAFVGYPASYGIKARQRMDAASWRSFNGWCGHQHVPENDHGDPGAIAIKALLQQGGDMVASSRQGLTQKDIERIWGYPIGDEDDELADRADRALLNTLKRIKNLEAEVAHIKAEVGKIRKG